MKIGILGYGYMGTIRHRVLAARSDVEVVRIFHEGDAPMHAARWQDVTDDPALDAVVVCLPNDVAVEATCRALAAGKHVLAEKPPGRSLPDLRRMMSAEAASGRTLQFGFNLRFHPAVRALRDQLASGALGSVRWLRGVYGKPKASDFVDGWRADPDRAGGGILLDQGIHMLDLIEWLAGPFDVVRAVGAGGPVEDDVMVVMKSRAGVVASLHSSHGQSPPRFSLELGLERGSALVDGLLTRTGRYGPERIVWGPTERPRAHETTFETDDSWALEVDAFLSSARSGTTPERGSTSDALALMMLVGRIYDEAAVGPGLR